MNHAMRRKDRALPESEAYRILAQGGDGVLATIGEDGYPYAVPVNHVYQDGVIYLHSAMAGHKLENLAHCDLVSYCVVTEREVVPEEVSTNYESVIVFGRAHLVKDPEEKQKGLMALLHRFTPNDMDAGLAELAKEGPRTQLIRIDIQRITGKARRKPH